MNSAEQAKIEMCASAYLRNIIVIMVAMELRPDKELRPMCKDQVDLTTAAVN